MPVKRVVSLSLGSSKRDKTVTADLFGETFEIARIGTNGDEQAFMRQLADLDGTVDAIGVRRNVSLFLFGRRAV
jgi:hypothetical protein